MFLLFLHDRLRIRSHSTFTPTRNPPEYFLFYKVVQILLKYYIMCWHDFYADYFKDLRCQVVPF